MMSVAIMLEEHLELWIAFFACLILAVSFVIYTLFAVPSGGHPFGLFIGIVGMMLMLVTETVYTIRKRAGCLRWLGPLRVWLSFHIFTGIVGPFLVLLHSTFAVGGLAGFALLMAGVVVLSGFVGRYIYTAVPRTRAGIEMSRDELMARARALQEELGTWVAKESAAADRLGLQAARLNPEDWRGPLARAWQDRAFNRRLHSAFRSLGRAEQARLRELERLLRRQHRLDRQIASLGSIHRLMRAWRLIHVPLGATLFTAAFIHIVAALYFKGMWF